MAETIGATFDDRAAQRPGGAQTCCGATACSSTAEDIGGERPRSLQLSVRDGRLRVYSGAAYKEL